MKKIKKYSQYEQQEEELEELNRMKKHVCKKIDYWVKQRKKEKERRGFRKKLKTQWMKC